MSDLVDEQTQFAAESVFYQPDEAEELAVVSSKKSAVPSNNKFRNIIIGLVSILLILIFSLVMKGGSDHTDTSQKKAEIKTIPLTQKEVDPFAQRLVELNKALEQADPSLENLPFPPVSANISLE